jgi:hypothetical protein
MLEEAMFKCGENSGSDNEGNDFRLPIAVYFIEKSSVTHILMFDREKEFLS